MKTLMVFDFDHTVVDDNSDTWVIRYTARMRLQTDSVPLLIMSSAWTV